MSSTQGGLWNYGRRRKENVGRPGIWDGCDFWRSGGGRGKENGREGGGKEGKEGGKEKRHRQEEERKRHRQEKEKKGGQEELKRHGRNYKVLRVMFYDKNVFNLRIEEA